MGKQESSPSDLGEPPCSRWLQRANRGEVSEAKDLPRTQVARLRDSAPPELFAVEDSAPPELFAELFEVEVICSRSRRWDRESVSGANDSGRL